MKKTLTLLAIAATLVGSASIVQAGSVKSEEAFDRAAGLSKRAWKKAPKVMRFPSPTPPQVLPGLPPWSQQPQGAQSLGPTFLLPPGA